MSQDLLALLDRLSRPRVLVLGDVMLDRYTLGAVDRISPEAPIPVLHASEQRDQLGGAASVAAMLGRLDAQVRLAGIRGADEPGEALLRQLDRAGIDPSLVLVDPSRPTTG